MIRQVERRGAHRLNEKTREPPRERGKTPICPLTLGPHVRTDARAGNLSRLSDLRGLRCHGDGKVLLALRGVRGAGPLPQLPATALPGRALLPPLWSSRARSGGG